jgi:DNA polymerase (family 10)
VLRIKRSFAALERFQASGGRVRLLKALEVDVRADGSLALPDALLREAEFVIGVLRAQTREDQTMRALRALEYPALRALAMYAASEAADSADVALDFERVVRRARERRCALLISGGGLGPVLDEEQCRTAKRAGVPICLGSAARRVEELEQLSLSVTQARRGWLQPRDVSNARSLRELMRRLGGGRSLHAPAGAAR